jgi:predicted CXXCH cytochrome family protein
MHEDNMYEQSKEEGEKVMEKGGRAMKKFLFLGIGSALVFTMGGVGPAQADNGPHRSTAAVAGSTGNLLSNSGGTRCASCHRAHTAKAEFLLKEAQPGLCYSCHTAGVGASTDVVNGIDAGNGAALRGGGFNTAAIGSGLATKDMGALDVATGRIATLNQQIPALAIPVASTSKHQIDGVTSGTAWGNGATGSGIGKSLTLECGSCHDPHGNGNYRILRPIPVDSGYASHEIKAAIPFKAGNPAAVPPVPDTLAVPAVMSPATGIKIPDASAKVYTTANYWLSGDLNVPVDPTAPLTGTKKATDGAADGYINNIANWCTTCHTRYLADTGSYKTDSGDAIYMYKHRSNANYKAGAANCITCHVSHGSNAVMAGKAIGVNPGDTAVVGADSRLLRVNNRGTCVMCHNV